jgi:glycosyltransferase involved in cell wall biosynthesis
MKNNIKVLHLTTHNEVCGIAEYQEQFIEAMKGNKNVENVIFNFSPNKTKLMTSTQYDEVLVDFKNNILDADMLHIQHELSFYQHKELESVINLTHSLNKPVVVTIHTDPSILYKKAQFEGYLPKHLVSYRRHLKDQRHFEEVHLNPLKKADLILVHNNVTKNNLVKLGFSAQNISIINIPVPELNFKFKSIKLLEKLNIKDDDILLCTVGFISRTKGIDHAIKALRLLSKNYKLAVIGGVHPNSNDKEFLDEITDYIVTNGLLDRVYITGYLEDDNELNAMIREADICLYPYDQNYYSYVSSAALNNSFANYRPTIAYSTPTFQEINTEKEIIRFCKSPNYYELAREIQNLDTSKYSVLSKEYANKYSYSKEAIKLVDVYKQLLKKIKH